MEHSFGKERIYANHKKNVENGQADDGTNAQVTEGNEHINELKALFSKLCSKYRCYATATAAARFEPTWKRWTSKANTTTQARTSAMRLQ